MTPKNGFSLKIMVGIEWNLTFAPLHTKNRLEAHASFMDFDCANRTFVGVKKKFKCLGSD